MSCLRLPTVRRLLVPFFVKPQIDGELFAMLSQMIQDAIHGCGLNFAPPGVFMSNSSMFTTPSSQEGMVATIVAR
jgi:hypothetical protein